MTTPVHPHACGEYSQCQGRSGYGIGSSPRVWGIPGKKTGRGRPSRFIPTRVGNTSGRCPAYRHGTVHPHACGEYGDGGFSAPPKGGSSPRVWGIRRHR